MTYKVLYRKYRPTDFENIVDQNYTIEILKNAITKNKISHAYIFSGPRGTGKTTTAKVFAKSINCENYSNEGVCGQCPSCLNFASNPDIIEIDAASNNGVDEIRELINSVKLAPTNSRYKVYIIDEVHMLSQSAFNALLLTLEEPPKHVVFILATTNLESVPVTILSRCQRFDFKKITDTEIIKRMKFICEEEKITISEQALEEIAYLADGGMRDALSILDQLSSMGEEITLEKVISHFGSVSLLKINELISAIEYAESGKVISIISEFRQSSVDYKHVIKKILDVLYKRAILSKEDKEYNGLEYSKIKNLTFDLVDCMNKINVIVDPYTLIEITLLNYVDNCNVTNKNEIKSEISVDNLNIESEEMVKNEIETIFDNSSLKSTRINNCFVNAKKDYLEQVKANWSKYIDELKDNKRLIAFMMDANPVAASDKYIVLTANIADTSELINVNLRDLEEAYNNLFETSYKFVSVSESEWVIEKAKYIENVKNKYQYNFIEEHEEVVQSDSFINNPIEEIANNIFDKDKIEIN